MMQETEGQVASSGAGVANAQEIIALRNIQFDHSSCTERSTSKSGNIWILSEIKISEKRERLLCSEVVIEPFLRKTTFQLVFKEVI